MPWADGTTTARTAAQLEDLVVNEFAGGIVGSGDAQHYGATATAAQLLAVKSGTAAAPDTALHPLVKIERTISIAEAAITGDGVEQCSGLLGVTVGTAACEVQPVGVTGIAKTSSIASSPGNDACGLYGVGRVTGSGTGSGIGGFLIGRADSTGGRVCGVEIACHNASGVDHSVLVNGSSVSKGVWLNSTGPNRSSAGIQLGNAFGSQFDVGLHFNAQVVGGFTGPTLNHDIRSDSTAATAIGINGTHATAAIHITSGSGKVMIGASSAAFASALLEVMKLTGGADPIASFRAQDSGAISVSFGNSAGSAKHWTAGSAGNFLTGTVAGDHGINVSTAGKAFHLGGTTKVVTVTQANELAFFAGAGATKQTVTGAKGGNAAITSLLAALVAYGFVTDSTTA